MYRKFYGLKADPFRLSPDHAFCLPHRSFAKAKAYMRYAMHRGEGFVMITGAPGTGKTTLIDDLLAGTRDAGYRIARLVSAQVEADDILRMVAAEFGISVSQTNKSEILRLLSNHFTLNFKQGKRSLLIVDEAQGLGLTALEELRLLTNLRIGGQPMLQIFLVGQEELRDMVTSPELEQLNQRMIAAYHMEPLKPDEFVAYVLHRLTVAGWKGNPRFTPALFPELFRFSNGLPRRINHICSRLLLHGFLEEKAQLDADDMEIVIKELRAEHYAIKENTALITQDKFNAEDLQRMARSAMSDQAATEAVLAETRAQAAAAAKRRIEQSQMRSQQIVADQASPTAVAAEPGRQSGKIHITPSAAQPLATSAVAEQAPGQPDNRAMSEPLDIDQQLRSGLRRAFFKPPVFRRFWAAASTLTVGLSLLLLVSIPSHQLNKVASQSLWNDIGVTKFRTQVSSWSGGRLPLKGSAGYGFQPVSPAAIERGDAEPSQALGKFKTAAVSQRNNLTAPQLQREILGETAPVLSESGALLFK
ncbi:MAG: AAA family ATPase [Chromatiaceae bacterium]|nr:AAA family ATPase [Chromatiaceae bacterium]